MVADMIDANEVVFNLRGALTLGNVIVGLNTITFAYRILPAISESLHSRRPSQTGPAKTLNVTEECPQ